MWGDPSKRPLAIIGAVLCLFVVVVGVWWWASRAPQRHLESIVNEAFDVANVDGPNSFGKYNRQEFAACGDRGEHTGSDAWLGFLGGGYRLDNREEAGRVAVQFADGLEQAGWDVRRFIVPDGDGDLETERRVQAERNDDTLEVFIQGVTIDVVASTGPCNSPDRRDLDDPSETFYEPVDTFPS